MANDLLTLLAETGDRLNLDMTITANKTRGIRWLNIIQNDISSRYPFDFLMTNGFVQTVTDLTAGTITTVAASTSFTGSGTAFTTANAANRYIQVQNDTNWYEVSSVAGQVLTTTKAAVSSASGLTYVLRTTYYDLPANCFKVFDVRQTNTPVKMVNLGIYSLDQYQPDINTTSNPTGYFLFGDDPLVAVSAAKQTQIGFFPCPDVVYNIQLRYFLNMTDLSGDTDITIIPVPYTNVLLDGAEWLGNKFLNEPGETQCKKGYEFGIKNMIERENANDDYFPVLQSSDSNNPSPYLQMPGNFPLPSGGSY